MEKIFFEHLADFETNLKGRYNSFITTAFDDSMTVEMQMRSYVKLLKDTRKLNNKIVDYLNKFIKEFDERLYDNIFDILNKWLKDGVFDELIGDRLIGVPVTIYKYGAKPNTDCTESIQEAVDKNRLVYIPEGTYYVDMEKMIKLNDNNQIIMTPNTVLKGLPTDATNHTIFNIENKKNITISGGILDGNRSEHIGTTGEWGFGFELRKGENVTIKNVNIKNFWGDGIYVGGHNYANRSRNVIVDNVAIDNCRRQGISVINVSDLTINNTTITNTNGAAPEAAIDFEPNNADEVLEGITINNLTSKNNKGGAFWFVLNNMANDIPVDIRINNVNSYRDGRVGIRLVGGQRDYGLKGIVTFNNISLVESYLSGIHAINITDLHPIFMFDNVIVKDANYGGTQLGSAYTSGVFVQGGITPLNKNVVFNNLTVYNTKKSTSVHGFHATNSGENGVEVKLSNYEYIDERLGVGEKINKALWIGIGNGNSNVSFKYPFVSLLEDSSLNGRLWGAILETKTGSSLVLPDPKGLNGCSFELRVSERSNQYRLPTVKSDVKQTVYTYMGEPDYFVLDSKNTFNFSSNSGKAVFECKKDGWYITELFGSLKQKTVD